MNNDRKLQNETHEGEHQGELSQVWWLSHAKPWQQQHSSDTIVKLSCFHGLAP